MATSSADPDALDDFVSTSRDLNNDLASKVTALVDAYEMFLAQPNDVRMGSSSQSGSPPPRLEHFGDTVHMAGTHRGDRDAEANWTEVVSRAFRQAGSSGPTSSLDDAVIDGRLAAAGVPIGAPRMISVEAPSAAGLAVDSGFKDDPVNCASGAFVQPEVDLPAPRRLWALGWLRNHNSRFPRPGPLGRGWSSWATTRLELSEGGARFEGPDGQVVELARTEAGFSVDPSLDAEVMETDAGAELAWWSGERWRFGHHGRPTEVALGPAGTVRFEHDHGGHLRAMAHAAGRRLDVDWDGDRIVAVRASDATGVTHATVTYRYVDGDLVEAEAPAGRRTYEVDDEGRVVAVVDADGVEMARNTYDVEGRVLAQQSPRGLRTTYEYNPGPVTTVQDGDQGPKVVMLHDSGGRLVGAIDDHGARITRRFDEHGNLTSVRDRAGATTSHELGPRGRLARRILPGGGEERFTYDGLGRLAALEDASGAVTTLGYQADADVVPCRITDPEGATTVVEVEGDVVRRVTDADGVIVTIESDHEGFPVRLTDGLGHTRELRRDHGGRITAVRLPGGQVQRFDHDVAGRPVRRVDPDGAVWEARWSAAGRLTGYTTPDGSHFEWRHDPTGDVDAFVDPLGAVTAMRTDLFGNVVKVVAADGAKFDLTYDGLSRLIAAHDPAGGATLHEHDANGRVVATTDALGHTRRVEYDQAGNVTLAVDAEGREVTMTYDQAGRVLSCTLPGGGTVVVERDRCGRPVAATDPTGRTTRYEYTPAGRLRRVVSPLGHASEWHHDAAGQVEGHTDPAGATTRFRRNSNGWITRVEHPDGEVTRLLRDQCGRVVERHHPDGGVDRLGYDGLGRLVEVCDPAGCRRQRRYDGRGVLVEAVDGAGGVTRWHHDVRGLPAAVTDASGGTTRFERDAMGRVTATTDALGRVSRVEYDQAGRARRLVEPDGRTWELRYDRTSALVGIAANGEEAVMERDAQGRVTRLLDHTGDHRFQHDGAGRLMARHGPAGTLRWRYDADGRPAALVFPDGTEQAYEYDAVGRVVALSHPVAGRVQLTRDVAGRLVAMRAPGVERSWTWMHHRLVGYQEADHAVTLLRDQAGRVVEVRRGGLVTAYRYDGAGRLIEAGGDSWQYDAAGRMAAEDGPAGPVRYSYDAAHRLVRVERSGSVTEMNYDGGGRRLSECGEGSGRRYRWDGFGRLAGVDGTDVSVNLLGELVAVDGVALAWDTSGLLPQLRLAGERKIVGAGEAWAVVTGDGVRWLSRDWDASPLGAVCDPWGRATDPVAALEPGFRGEWTLDGLVWLRQRAYDPNSRSFLSPDPLAGVPGFTTVANPYHYGHHDPVGRVDPLGLEPLTDAEWDAWKASHPTLAPVAAAPIRAGVDFVGEHWEVIAAAAVVAAGVGLCFVPGAQMVGAGILIGAGSNLAIQAVSGGPIDARNMALAGLVGGGAAGIGMLASNAVSGLTAVGASSYSAAVPQLAGGAASGFSNGMLTETVAEQMDKDASNDGFSPLDVATKTADSLVFSGISSVAPYAHGPVTPVQAKDLVTQTRLPTNITGSLSTEAMSTVHDK